MKTLNIGIDYNTLSHELRIPLTGILGMAEILSSEEGLSAEQKEQVAVIRQAGDRLLGFIEKILNSPKREVRTPTTFFAQDQSLAFALKEKQSASNQIRLTV